MYVNRKRLSAEGCESEPYELKNGDILVSRGLCLFCDFCIILLHEYNLFLLIHAYLGTRNRHRRRG